MFLFYSMHYLDLDLRRAGHVESIHAGIQFADDDDARIGNLLAVMLIVDGDVRCRTVLKSVLTQLWCTRGTCGTLAGIDDKSVILPNLFSDLSNVTLRSVFKTDQGWIMEAHGQNSAACPGCQSISRSRHSRYWRSLKDLPVQGTQVILRLRLGRWRCRNAGCERRIFTERLSKVCAPYAQQTKRTGEIIAAVGHALGGRPGQRLMSRLGMPVSADTLIRQVKRAARLAALPHG